MFTESIVNVNCILTAVSLHRCHDCENVNGLNVPFWA